MKDEHEGLEDQDIYEDDTMNVAEFMLSPAIPMKERQFYEKYYITFSKLMATGYIKRPDIRGFLIENDFIKELLRCGLYEQARERMGRLLSELQLSRSVDGFYTLYGHGVHRYEYHNRMDAQNTRKGILGSILGRKKKQEPPQGSEPVA